MTHNVVASASASVLLLVLGPTPASGQMPGPGGASSPSLAASAAPAAAPLTAETRRAVIDGVIQQISANYVFENKVAGITRALRRHGTQGEVGRITDPQAFAAALTTIIKAEAKDAHLQVRWSPEQRPAMERPAQPDPARLQAEIAMIARNNFEISKVEVLKGNIGYLRMDMFAPAPFAGPTFAAAMAFLKHTDAMIFDLRENGGGDPAMVALAASYLLPPGTKLNSFRRRGQADLDQSWTLPFVPGGPWSDNKPVYVLTSRKTGSAAEEFAYDLQQLKRATIVGDRTWGGANPGDIFPAGNNFAVFVPTEAAVNPISGTNWEGAGVQPDVRVEPAGALEAARRLALASVSAASPERADPGTPISMPAER